MSENTVADFSLPATGNKSFTFSGARGKHLVIYFYPKDNTQGCSTETQRFRDLYTKFTDANCEVVGVSRGQFEIARKLQGEICTAIRAAPGCR